MTSDTVVWLVYPDNGECPPVVWATRELAYTACASLILDTLDEGDLQQLHKDLDKVDPGNIEVVAWYNERMHYGWRVHAAPVQTALRSFP